MAVDASSIAVLVDTEFVNVESVSVDSSPELDVSLSTILNFHQKLKLFEPLTHIFAEFNDLGLILPFIL